MDISLLRLPPAEWPALAGFIHRWNRRPGGGVRCLHAAHGADLASHAQELAKLSAAEAAFWAVRQGQQLVGVVGCEVDAALGRAWVRGPLASEPRVLDAMLSVVGPTLEAALPEVRHFDAFPSADDTELNAWYAAAGYDALQLNTVLRAAIVNASPSARTVARASPRDLPVLLQLHETLFPSAYIGEADFLRALAAAGDRVLFVARADDDAPVGYLYMRDDPIEQEAYVDYLGVIESQRGRGLGRALLDAAAAWGAGRGRGHLALTVREDRHSALALYKRAGFVEVSAGRHWRKAVSSRDAAA